CPRSPPPFSMIRVMKPSAPLSISRSNPPPRAEPSNLIEAAVRAMGSIFNVTSRKTAGLWSAPTRPTADEAMGAREAEPAGASAGARSEAALAVADFVSAADGGGGGLFGVEATASQGYRSAGPLRILIGGVCIQ